MRLIKMLIATGLVVSSVAQLNAQSWNLNGNAGTNSAVNFAGTSDNRSFVLRSNNVNRVFIDSTGKVGIGTSAPTAHLHFNGGKFIMSATSVGNSSIIKVKSKLEIQDGNTNTTFATFDGVNDRLGIGTVVPATALDVNGVITATGGNSGNWNTAFSWGDHSLAGYLTTEVDPEVGANTLNYVSKWDGSALVTSNVFSNGTFTGINTNSAIGAAQLVVGNINATYGGMYLNSTGVAGSRKPFYGYALSGVSDCWTYLDEATTSWKVYNGGDRLTVDNQGQVGIGTTTPGYYLDIQASTTFRALNASSSFVGNVGQIVNFERTSPPSTANDIVQITVPSGSPADFQFIEADQGGINRFQVNGDGSVAAGGSNVNTARLYAYANNNGTNRKLYGLYAIADSASSSSYAVYGLQTNATSNARGVFGSCTGGDGIGYGVYGSAGFIGVRGFGNGGAYVGSAYGVYGSAGGSTAGTRIGVYGTASGGATTDDNWGGYFPTKVYTNEIRVGTTNGAAGYIASIGGKLIAEEVRVELEGSWPDYVFNNGYQLMPLEDVEKHIREYNRLPGMPSACEVEDNGIMLGNMQTKTMLKVEENTLYIIQLNKQIEAQNAMIEALKKQLDSLMNK